MSDLRLQNKAHAVCSKLFLRVAHFCQIFAYRTWHTKCVVSCFSGSLIDVGSSLTDEAHEVCSKLFLRVPQLCQIFAYRTVCSKLFLRVAQLSQVFAYRTRHTPCVVSCFFGSLTYVRSSLTEQGTRSV